MDEQEAPVYWILDAQGTPVPADDSLTWTRWFERADRRIARDDIAGCRVSTVFLGIDHGLGRPGAAPLLYETMVFGGPLDKECRRYATRAEALAGHAELVRLVSEDAATNGTEECTAGGGL